MKKALAILIRARGLLSHRTRWCKDTLAKDRDGSAVDPKSLDAVQWCAIGAVRRFGPHSKQTTYHVGQWDRSVLAAVHALERAADALYPQSDPSPSIVNVNDVQGYAAVLRMYDRAITTLRRDIRRKTRKVSP